MNPAENSTNNGKKVSKSTSFSYCTILQKSKWFKKHEIFVLNPFEENKTVQKAWVFCAAEMVQKVWVLCATPICTKKKNGKFFVPHQLSPKKNGSKVWVFVLHNFAGKNGSKSMSFLCRTILQEKNGSKSMNFLCRTIL